MLNTHDRSKFKSFNLQDVQNLDEVIVSIFSSALTINRRFDLSI